MGGRGSSGGNWEHQRSLQIHLSNGLSVHQAVARVPGTTINQARAVQRSMRASARKNPYRATDQELH